MIAELPFDSGASQFALALIPPPGTPATAVPILGAEETVTGATGVTTFDAVDRAPVLMALTAATRKLYAVPFVNAVMLVDVTLPTPTVRTTVVPVSTWTE